MKELWSFTQAVITTLGGILGWFLGGLDGLLYTLIVFVVLDYVTGLLNAINEKKLSSETGFKGIAKKIIIFMLVGIAHILDAHILGQIGVLRSAVIFFYLSNEGISILENASKIGLPIPQKLQDILEQLNKREEK